MKFENTAGVPLILASGSAIRKTILTNAGVKFDVQTPRVDESALKEKAGSKTAWQMSALLAAQKAQSIRADNKTLVIGADQILEYDGQQYDKARTPAEARARLRELSGKTHALVGTTVLVRKGAIIWEHQSKIEMTMRNLGDGFIDEYLRKAGQGVMASVGGYEIEGPGITLFESIKGDWFCILGLALMPLLKELRRLKAIAS